MTKRTDLPPATAFLTAHFPGEKGRLLCAVSGGLDSMCLLDVACRWARDRGWEVAAAHFQHGLRGQNALRDCRFVQDWCKGREIPCFTGEGDARDYGARHRLSLEEAARELRYAFLEEVGAQGFDGVLTAHHADDQAETVLLNLIRGGGSAGGGGIPPVRGRFYRPFLQIPRKTLEEYARTRGLPHVEDETNALDEGSRNLLRHHVVPVLRQINPRAVENLARSACLLAEENAALEGWAGELLSRVRQEGEKRALALKTLRSAPEVVGGRVVLAMMADLGGARRELSAAHAKAALNLSPGQETALPYGLRACSAGGELVVFRPLEPPETVPLLPGGQVTFGQWQVGLTGPAAPPEGFWVTTWQPRDRLRLPGSRGSRSLKRLLAEAGVPPWERDGLPVLRLGRRAVAAAGIGTDGEFAAEKRGYQVTFRRGREGEDQ